MLNIHGLWPHNSALSTLVIVKLKIINQSMSAVSSSSSSMVVAASSIGCMLYYTLHSL